MRRHWAWPHCAAGCQQFRRRHRISGFVLERRFHHPGCGGERCESVCFLCSWRTQLGRLSSWRGVAVFDLFPTAVGITSGVVVVLVGLAFWSVAIPLRALYSIALTLAFAYASAVWVFEVSRATPRRFAMPARFGLHLPGLLISGGNLRQATLCRLAWSGEPVRWRRLRVPRGVRGLLVALQGAMSWITPVLSFSVLVGIQLDYECFLLSR